MYITDPLIGYFEIWALHKQLIQYFKYGEGKSRFGDRQGEVIAMLVQLESGLDNIYIHMVSEIEKNLTETLVNEWGQENPISDPYFTRKTVLPDFAAWTGAEHLGLGGRITTITDEV